MKKIFLVISLLLYTTLFSYIDSDFDGVDDAVDRCPNTPFMELVDINGCTTMSLISPHNFDIIIGTSYSDSDYQTLNQIDTTSSSLQVDYYYKKFSLQVSTSYFKTKGSGYQDSGLYDSFLGASYQFELLKELSLRVGTGIIIPTYKTSLNNNKMDYVGTLNFSYTLSSFNIFGGYSYTMINDDDITIIYNSNTVQNIKYQNTNAFNAGIGYYFTNSFYANISFNSSSSVYATSEDIQTSSVYLYYTVDEHWFSTFSYAKGISASASKNYASLRFGYFF